ncbi:hypothetical protein HDU98_002998, partial [Podochytrium sp. JEL0797]
MASSFKDKYILSLEEHCAVSDALRVAETVAHALEKDVKALQHEVDELRALAALPTSTSSPIASPPRNPVTQHLPDPPQPQQQAPQQQQPPPPTPQSAPPPQPPLAPPPIPTTPTTTTPLPPPITTTSYPPSASANVPRFITPYSPSPLALSLTFTLPPPPDMFPSGARNNEGVRAWTDVLRAKYPTFKRTSPAMSKSAKDFMGKHVPGHKVYIASLTG